jgi:predicted O-methyltransferase YrrM
MASKIIDASNLDIQHFINSNIVKDIDTERSIHLLKSLEKVETEGLILEFGVFKGTTINIISNFFKNEICWGFDSFEGLPEDWLTKSNSNKTSYPKNHFAVDHLPVVNKNVKLVKGYFNNTLPIWIKENQADIKFLHIDCDLYSSTKTILTLLNYFIKPGTVIVFDEIYHWESQKYSNWREGEYKALKEWITDFDRSFEILHRNRHMQCAIKVIK